MKPINIYLRSHVDYRYFLNLSHFLGGQNSASRARIWVKIDGNMFCKPPGVFWIFQGLPKPQEKTTLETNIFETRWTNINDYFHLIVDVQNQLLSLDYLATRV